MGDESAITAARQEQLATTAPKKRFIGKAKAEALRRQALLQKDKKDGISIEDGVVALKGPPFFLWPDSDCQGHHREEEEW
jgi:hypothetical protein